jgi:hypothetical protein
MSDIWKLQLHVVKWHDESWFILLSTEPKCLMSRKLVKLHVGSQQVKNSDYDSAGNTEVCLL